MIHCVKFLVNFPGVANFCKMLLLALWRLKVPELHILLEKNSNQILPSVLFVYSLDSLFEISEVLSNLG